MANQVNKIEQIKTLENGRGLQYLLNKASEVFGNPILMHDLDCKAIAYTENVVTDDRIWNDFVTNGGHTSEVIELFINENIFDTAANAKTVAILNSVKLKNDRIFGRVRNKDNITVAGVDLVCCYKPFEDGDLEVFEVFCQKLSKEINKNEYYQIYGQTYQEKLIEKLIDGDIEDKRVYPVHIDSIYSGLKENIYLGVADVTKSTHGDSSPAYFKDLFKQTQPAFKYAIYSNYVIFIFRSDDTKLNLKRGFKNLKVLFEQNNIYVGISSYFENLFELSKYYHEAVNTLNYGLNSNSIQRIFLYDEIV